MSKHLPAELRITGPARRDITTILRWSIQHFGEAAASRYEALIAQAFRDLLENPVRPGSKERPELMIAGARTYHLFLSRRHLGIDSVKELRHFILYRYRDGVLEIARVLHDRRDLPRHLPEEYKPKE